jgi:hypothetical protein
MDLMVRSDCADPPSARLVAFRCELGLAKVRLAIMQMRTSFGEFLRSHLILRAAVV